MDEQSFYIKDMLANLMELIRHRKIQKTQDQYQCCHLQVHQFAFR